MLILGPKDSGPYGTDDLNLLAALAQVTALALENAERQFLAESYAVRAQVLVLLYGEALKRHDRVQIHALRSLARNSLQQELGVDPSTVTLDRLACLGTHPFSCENYLVLMRPAVGGRTPTVQEMRRVISPMAP